MDKQLLKFIRSFVAFLLVAGVFYYTMIIIYGEYVPEKYAKNLNYSFGKAGHNYSRLKEVKKRKNVDILFLGSSHTYRGFDTRIFESEGFSCYNLGSSSQTPLQTNVLLKRYLNQLKPKLVVYEVYPVCFTLDGVESSLDLISNDKNDVNSFVLAKQQNHIKVYNTLLYALYAELTHKNANYNEPKHQFGDTYIEGGFVQKKLAFYTKEPHKKVKWEFIDQQLEVFDENLAMLKELKIPYILIQAPVTKEVYNSYSNNRDFDSMMKRKGNYVNFNHLMKLNDSLDFYDDDHLNQYGVVKFNHLLLSTLLKKSIHKKTQHQ